MTATKTSLKSSILLVDDEPLIHTFIQNLLEPEYDIINARSASQALEILEKKDDIEVILLDINMPGMDGFELAAAIKNNDELYEIPIIFLTASDEEEDIEKAFELGAIDYLQKPVNLNILKAKLKVLVKNNQELEEKNPIEDNEIFDNDFTPQHKIIFAEPDKDLLEMYNLHIEAQLNTEAITFTTGDDVINFLEKCSEVNLIIYETKMINGDAQNIFNYMRENALDIPVIFLGDSSVKEFYKSNPEIDKSPQRKQFIYLKHAVSTKELIKTIKKNCSGIKEEQQLHDNFSRIRLIHFLRFNNVNCDIYIKISKNKFIKVFNRDDMYTQKDIQKYLHKRCQYFYVQKEDFANFSKYYASTIINTLNNKKVDRPLIENAVISANKLIQQQLNDIGLSPQLIQLTNKSIQATISIIKKDTKLFELLESFEKHGDYLYEHGLMISYVACSMAAKLTWGTFATLNKLTLASFFHDITLKDEKLAKVRDLLSADFAELPTRDINAIKKHPTASNNIVQQFKNIPPDVDKIILEHHESQFGKGFPRGLMAKNISQLSVIFIIAEDFVERIYDQEISIELRDKIIEEFEERYTEPNFKKMLVGLIASFH